MIGKFYRPIIKTRNRGIIITGDFINYSNLKNSFHITAEMDYDIENIKEYIYVMYEGTIPLLLDYSDYNIEKDGFIYNQNIKSKPYSKYRKILNPNNKGNGTFSSIGNNLNLNLIISDKNKTTIDNLNINIKVVRINNEDFLYIKAESLLDIKIKAEKIILSNETDLYV